MRSFAPAPGLSHAMAQSIWPRFTRSFVRVEVQHEVWDTPDDDVLDIDLLPERPDAPAVLVIHGLEASSRVPYVRGLLAMIGARGWNGAALNFRGCGPTPYRNPRLYHAGFTDDIELAVGRLLERWNGAPLGLVGYSLGANMLINWLGKRPDAPVVGAIGISPPYDLAGVARIVDGPGLGGRFWRRRFLRKLKRKALILARNHPDVVDYESIRRANTFLDFDGAYTARIFGFDGAKDYWAQTSCQRFVGDVGRPTLLISSEDDPLIPGGIIPRDRIDANPHVDLWQTRHGGHVGFVGGSALRPIYAADEAALDYLAELFPTSPRPA